MPPPSIRPRGHYLADEAGRLAGVSGTTIGQWARRGYIRSSRSPGPRRVYCFQDVAEAMVVHELMVRGVGMRAIKAAIDRLRGQRETNWPLQQSRLLVPGAAGERSPRRRTGSIVVEEDDGHTDLVSGHPVLAGLDLETLVAELARGGWAAR